MMTVPFLEKLHDNTESLDDLDMLLDSIQIDITRVRVLGYLRITSGEHRRLDKVARDIYGMHGMLEYIMRYNGILNPFNLEEGDVIAIPDIASIVENTIVETYQRNFLESATTSLTLNGTVSIKGQGGVGGRPTAPNRQVGGRSGVRVDEKNGILIF